jgi:carbon storage regulator CsrA
MTWPACGVPEVVIHQARIHGTQFQEKFMLVLSRKQGEAIQIDSNIRVVVVSITKGRVRLGIEAPDHMRILRSELEDWETDNMGSLPVTSMTSEGAMLLAPR